MMSPASTHSGSDPSSPRPASPMSRARFARGVGVSAAISRAAVDGRRDASVNGDAMADHLSLLDHPGQQAVVGGDRHRPVVERGGGMSPRAEPLAEGGI